jgi:hypothetical protein
MIPRPREGSGSYCSDERQTRRTYRPVANGRPGTGPRSPAEGGYSWRADGWRARARRAGLDVEALLALAEAETRPGRRAAQ